MYRVTWTERSIEDLKSLPLHEAKRIKKKIENYLTQDPASLGKPLTGELAGLYRYRMGDYRVIYHIEKQEVSITILYVGNRRTVYGGH